MKSRVITLGFTGLLSLLCVYFVACKKTVIDQTQDPQGDPALPSTPYDYASKHNVNSDYATLGRVLFYDRKLSVNDAVACGSCHKQEFAFANNTRFDRGFDGQLLNRNSPSIQGLRGFDNSPFSTQPNVNNQRKTLLFWDGRQDNLSDMVLNPVLNHKEMNMPGLSELVEKLNGTSYYKQLFINAFGDETITKERIALALEAFVCCLNTKVSPDSITVQNAVPEFNQIHTIEEMGLFLFHKKYNCAECHDQKPKTNNVPVDPYGPVDPGSDPTGNTIAFFNIGLDANTVDRGLGKVTGLAGDLGLFKVPTLQNISVTAPYMHDGRFNTLSEVLDHYSHNIQGHPNLSSKFKNFDGSPKQLNILPAEKEALIAFLKTLRNDDFLTSPMYSDPFKK